jgi:hypothetical protein
VTLIERLEKAASVHYEADNALRMAAARIRELEAASGTTTAANREAEHGK